MTRSAKITRLFGGEHRVFALTIGAAEELQEEFDCGLSVLLRRVGDVDVKAVRHVLRHGLLGGGMADQPSGQERAFRLVKRHVVPGELLDAASIAVDAIAAILSGAEDERLGEPPGEATTSPPSPEGSSDTASSTVSGLSWDGARPMSDAPPSGSSARRPKAGSARTAQAPQSV